MKIIYNILFKILKSILLGMVFFMGLWGLYNISGLYVKPFHGELFVNEKECINQYRNIVSSMGNQPNSRLESSNIVARNYNYGYQFFFEADSDIPDVVKFYQKKLINAGYSTKIHRYRNIIRAVKDEHVIVINIQEGDNPKKCTYSIYIKPNDIFEWRKLDLYFLEEYK